VEEWTKPTSSTEGIILESSWLIYCDGPWGTTRVGAATILISPSKIKLRYAARL
jgi:ribonuclease HI